jgi:hypothetical protein
MAAIAPTTTPLAGGNEVVLVRWTSITEADAGNAVEFPALKARTIQATGTFDSGSVALHGSNDGTNFVALEDWEGNAIAITSAGLVKVGDLQVRQIKPVITGGGGTQDITINLLMSSD